MDPFSQLNALTGEYHPGGQVGFYGSALLACLRRNVSQISKASQAKKLVAYYLKYLDLDLLPSFLYEYNLLFPFYIEF